MRQNKHIHAYEPEYSIPHYMQKTSIPHAYEPKSSMLMLMNYNRAYPMHTKKNQAYSCL